MNSLYYGDNLSILREYVKDESVDLVYLDPPFNSKASYNILFKERTGEESAAQIKAFGDTWHWGEEAERAYSEIMDSAIASSLTKEMVSSLRKALGDRNDMTAYLVMMVVRLLELRRVLKSRGSLYLHCDTTSSHYLKIVLDTIFGSRNFRNEIIWKRSNAHNDPKRYGRITDSILFYTKSARDYTWNPQLYPYSQEYLDSHWRRQDEGGRRFRLIPLDAPRHGDGGNLVYEWHGKWPAPTRTWAVVKTKMEEYERAGKLAYTKKGTPCLKRYLDETKGAPSQNLWADVPFVNPMSRERLGYATQKPIALLERIIQASSNEVDVVLDPFCGCGTAICAAHKLNRQWIGIDITHLAVTLMRHRLKDTFNLEPHKDYQVIGVPVDVGGARELAKQDRYEFQYWALSLVDARPEEPKKGADRGVDGTIFFLDGPQRSSHKMVIQVKSGHVSPSHIRDLKGVVEREGAALGFYISLESPTRDMIAEAASAGFFHSDLMNRDYPKIQVRTIAELLAGKSFEMPLRPVQFQQAQRVRRQEGIQPVLSNEGAH